MDYLDRASLDDLDRIYRRISSRGLSRGSRSSSSRFGGRDDIEVLGPSSRGGLDETSRKLRGLSNRIKEVVEDGYIDGLSEEEIFDKCVNVVKNRGKTQEEAEKIVKAALKALNI